MMVDFEREVVELFGQLGAYAQQRVLQILTAAVQPSFDYDVWWAEVESLQADIRERIGDTGRVGALSLLDDLREESS